MQCPTLQSQTLYYKNGALILSEEVTIGVIIDPLHQFAHANMQPIIICKRSNRNGD